MGYVVEAAADLRHHVKLAGDFDIAIVRSPGKDCFADLLETCAKILVLGVTCFIGMIESSMRRRRDINRRRGCALGLNGNWRIHAAQLDSADRADLCMLIGDESVLNSYPEWIRPKIRLIPTIPTPVTRIKTENYIPETREFLWLGGLNPVLKGVDLLLDVFSRRPEWILHLVGPVFPKDVASGGLSLYDMEFVREYERELLDLPNIRTHGYLQPNSEKFAEIAARCFCFVFPSCSEGISNACLTCLSVGLYPVLSRQTGVALPAGCGRILETCSIEEIDAVLEEIRGMPAEWLTSQIMACQALVKERYTHQAFTDAVETCVREAVAMKN
jgi:glycosyltransferase involved in cell wall biosynthesis